ERIAQTVPTAEVLRLFLRICETVGFAHAQGIVHRDLKPSNIMVGSFGEELVLDWGIARLTRDPETDRRDAPPADSDAGTAGGCADPTDTARARCWAPRGSWRSSRRRDGTTWWT